MLYVVLRHEGVDTPHFDLMVQPSPGAKLATWRLAAWPPAGSLALTRLPDHRTEYLTYEGEISGGRGTVRRVEQGICAMEIQADVWTIRLTPMPAGELRTLRLSQQGGNQWQCQVLAP